MRLLRVHTDTGLRDAVLTGDGRVATLAGEAEAFDPARWPAGVGAGQKPPRYLRAGDVLRVWADGLGEQHTRLV